MSIPRALRMTLKGFGVPPESLDMVEKFDIEAFRSQMLATAAEALRRAEAAEAALARIEATQNRLLFVVCGEQPHHVLTRLKDEQR